MNTFIIHKKGHRELMQNINKKETALTDGQCGIDIKIT